MAQPAWPSRHCAPPPARNLWSRARVAPHHVNARIPNALTVGRIAITPVMIVALAADSRRGDTIAAVIFAIASITDFVDGYLARRADVISAFGKLMDPIADKLLVVGALIPLVLRDRIGWWVAAVIILREALVTLSRMQIKRRGGEVIAAAQLGKLKTVVQLWAILLAIVYDPTPLLVDLVIWAAVLLTVVSAIDFYWRTYRGGGSGQPAAAPGATTTTG
ncbi:MAG: CDP-diacylglycerol--glycerol-3-phosphate 3-phosphatidyltransferase [Solirubrobacteraceae bacterium]|nr:CDP-diacylglycerol--glycerol-3-phosphate 3-phosphatidyltransferase [Solirubrobacteraceae bacterium]